MRWILVVVAVLALPVLGFGGYVAYSFATAKVDTIDTVDFDRPLAIRSSPAERPGTVEHQHH